MTSLWLFRTNLLPLEYYHKYKDLNTFLNKCHDFYLLQGIWYLQNTSLKEFIVFRLKPKNSTEHNDIIMSVDGKPFKQIFVESFQEVIKYPSPDIAFFRGGFSEYDGLINNNKKFFKNVLTLYLGASKRVTTKYKAKYDVILVENEDDLKIKNTLPYYKTTNSNIFKRLQLKKDIDILWICNNTQHRMKGQQFFVDKIKKNKYLRSLNIVHVGNKPEYLKDLLEKNKITNVKTLGYVSREEINILLNRSKCGLMTSDEGDGCPRVITEIITSGTPLIYRERVRILDYYKKFGVGFNDKNIVDRIKFALKNYKSIKKELDKRLDDGYCSMDNICRKNLNNLQKNNPPLQ